MNVNKGPTSTKGRRDLQNIISAVLESPIKEGELDEIDGSRSLESLRKKNTTVLTRIIIQMSVDAMKGDEKKAKILFDYAGLAPVKEQQVAVDLPQFVDDMSVSVTESDRPKQVDDDYDYKYE